MGNSYSTAYIDGIIAAFAGILWGIRQYVLNVSRNPLSTINWVHARYTSILLLWIIIVGTSVFILIALIKVRNTFAAPATITVLVGSILAAALDDKVQITNLTWVRLLSDIKKTQRYRFGDSMVTQPDTVYMFKETSTIWAIIFTKKLPKRSTWHTRLRKYKNHKEFYIIDWTGGELTRYINGYTKIVEDALKGEDVIVNAAAYTCMFYPLIHRDLQLIVYDTFICNIFDNSGSCQKAYESWRRNRLKKLLCECKTDHLTEEILTKTTIVVLEKSLYMCKLMEFISTYYSKIWIKQYNIADFTVKIGFKQTLIQKAELSVAQMKSKK